LRRQCLTADGIDVFTVRRARLTRTPCAVFAVLFPAFH
jgi:hypothetical protein